MLGVIGDYVLHRDYSIRESAQKAVNEAIDKNLLSDENQRGLKEHLWAEFQYSGGTREGERTNQDLELEDVELPKTERIQESVAPLLWKLRKYTSILEKSRLAPVAMRVWMADHRMPISLSAVSASIVIVLILMAWGIGERLRGKWYPVNTLFAGQVIAAAVHPVEFDTVYIVTPSGPAVGDGPTLLWRRGGNEWDILSQSFTSLPVNSLLVTYAGGKSRIYVSVRYGGILRSDDNGATWKSDQRWTQFL